MTFVEYYKCDACKKEYHKDEDMIVLFMPDKYDATHFCDKECLKKWLDEELK